MVTLPILHATHEARNGKEELEEGRMEDWKEEGSNDAEEERDGCFISCANRSHFLLHFFLSPILTHWFELMLPVNS